MNILLISPVPPPLGGMGIWTQTLIDYFKNSDNNLFLIDTSPRWRKIYQTQKVFRIIGGGIQLIGILLSVLKYLPKVDGCHLCTSGSFALIRDRLIILLCMLFNKNCIYHIHYGRIPQIEAENSIEWKLLKKNIQLAKIVLPLEKKSENVLKKYNNNIIRLPNPIKLYDKSNSKEEKIILFVGWNIITKGIEDLLEGWNHLENKHGWSLQIIGPGDFNYINALKEKYYCDNVVFIGEISHDKVIEYMSKAGIFILPSHTEAFPLVILEAMSLGKAIIGTDVGAIPEMLSDECGVIIRKQAPEEISNAINSLIVNDNIRKKIGDNAYEKIQKQYTTEVIFRKLEDIWRTSFIKKI